MLLSGMEWAIEKIMDLAKCFVRRNVKRVVRADGPTKGIIVNFSTSWAGDGHNVFTVRDAATSRANGSGDSLRDLLSSPNL